MTRADATSPSAVSPELPHNDRLWAAVHPTTWQNPEPAARYHLVVIGAGTAGLVTAAGAAGLGARVALIERHLMGGDCLNVGCVPSKAVIAAARAWSSARHAAGLGGPSTGADGDFAAVMDRMRRLRADIAKVDGAERFRSLGVDVFFGDGRFAGPGVMTVGSTVLRYRRAVIATGARAAVPQIPGLAGTPFHTNETLFDLQHRPDSLIVLGGGPIGCEMAQAFARLGTRVVLIARGVRLLPREDEDAARIVHHALERDGVQILLGQSTVQVTWQAGRFTLHLQANQGSHTTTVEGGELLVATGRTPNTESLGLGAVGVQVSPTGVVVNDRLQTTNPRIFACGDVCSTLQFTHAADFQARTVIQNALFFGRKRASALVVPRCTYTSPEVASVGLTAETAAAAGVSIDTVTVPLHEVDRAVLDGETEGFARVHVRRGRDTIVGATVVAAHAGELINEVTLCMTNGLGLSAIGATMHPYPTQGDALRKCADVWRRSKLTPTVRTLFARWFRLFS
jgi:pyruvate/2-oxoglutarate dehydrogenase complex dihydrolipoamide dehydrogenase (E3) component